MLPEGIQRRLSAPVARETFMYRFQDVSYIENCLRFLNNTPYIRNALSCARLFDTLIDLIIPPVPKSTVCAQNMPDENKTKKKVPLKLLVLMPRVWKRHVDAHVKNRRLKLCSLSYLTVSLTSTPCIPLLQQCTSQQ
jgi:hypothetical protein